ncbi:DUF2339 domain-containing protein [Sphingomonas hylomeconis]|uniref:DUF2339 domain-containing protein n=1 Tax=Sphingomonas hylomeconis TaxID=1395958 RepID=A0ABV7SS20_9SPHN|nr:DUF2339 domain-containing protein [Sphingomonas hylomeconis]
MVLWTAIIAAIAGWCMSDFETYGFVLGGLIGLVAGWGLRRTVRAEIAVQTRELQAQIDALLADRGDTAPFAGPAIERPAATVRAAATIRAPERSPVAPPEFTEPTDRVEWTEPHVVRDAAPAAPGAVDTIVQTAIAAARRWLFGGNTIVRIGLVILFVGLSFLASYAASAGLFPIERRLALVAAFGIALLGIGFRTRVARPDFGLALQGAGVATIYLTLFAAARLYDTVPVGAAFVLMILVCALGCALALLQKSQALAVTSFAGGFAVPLLLGGEGGNILAVFAYYTVLNLAILFIAQRRAWRGLNLLGFFATFGVATLWGVTAYQPADFAAAQFFLILSVLIYVATAVLYARATPGRFGNVVDTTLLFGPALAGFGLEAGLVHDMPFGSAFAAVGFAALYLGVAGVTARYRRDSFRVLNETMLAIGVGFVTLAVPLALGARWTSAAWALEGAGAFWVGQRQARWLPRLFGLALQAVAALLYLVTIGWNVSALPLANAGFVGAMLIAAALLATAWWLRRELPVAESPLAALFARYESLLARPAFLLGFGFWWLAWAVEIGRRAPPALRGEIPPVLLAPQLQTLLCMAVFLLSAWLWQAIGRRWRWPVATWPSHVSLAALALGLFGMISAGGHILDTPDWLIWIAAVALHLRMLYLNDREPAAADALRHATHVGGVWLAVAMLADCLALGIESAGLWQTSWAEVAWLAAGMAVLAVLTRWAGRALSGGTQARRWPLDRYAVDYAWRAAVPIAALVFTGALLVALVSSGATDPLPYIPLLNPVDLTLALALAVLALWRQAMVGADPVPAGAELLHGRHALAPLAALSFVLINTVWLRLAHHLLGVAWTPEALLASFVVQAGLAILWTLLGLALMVLAYRRGQRTLWLVGAALLGLTVVKLLLIDLTNAGGGARIVTFIVVGVLMLVVGYLAPLPPRIAADDDAAGRALA